MSTRIRTGRSIDALPFNPNMTEEQYKKMEMMAKEAFEKMPDNLQGDYHPLTGLLPITFIFRKQFVICRDDTRCSKATD